jgi:hypothetical protein
VLGRLESAGQIFKAVKWKCYVPRLLHAMVEDDPDHWAEFCDWFQRKLDEDAQFVDTIVWSDEATFTVNWHNCMYWSSENPNIHVIRQWIRSGAFMLTMLAQLMLWKWKMKSHFCGSVILYTLEHSRTNQIKSIINQLYLARHRCC